jgi:hypothetical protein
VAFRHLYPTSGRTRIIEQSEAFQNAVLNLVQQGSLNDLMDSIILEYGTSIISFRAWRSKANYLMAIYQEGA